MHDRVDGSVLSEGAGHDVGIGCVAHDEWGRFAGDLLDARRGHLGRIRQIVEQDDFVTCVEKSDSRVGTDVTGTAGEEYAHGSRLPVPNHSAVQPICPPDSRR